MAFVFLLRRSPLFERSTLKLVISVFKDSGPILRRGFQIGEVLVPEFIAVWLALSLYTAAFIGNCACGDSCNSGKVKRLIARSKTVDHSKAGHYPASNAGDYTAINVAIP